jgi:hypothetical protein
MKKLFISFILIFGFLALPVISSPVVVHAAAYPKASPSAYYVLPGQSLSFSGSRFLPNDTVTLTFPNGATRTFAASANGTVSMPNVMTIPYDWQNSRQQFTLRGTNTYSIPMTLVVGTFYPQISPSSYYFPSNSIITVRGRNFAPNETVQVMMNGTAVANVKADATGSLTTSFAISQSGTITATGMSSGTHSSRTVTVAK